MSALPEKAMSPAVMRIHTQRDKVIGTVCTWTHDFKWLVERLFDAKVLHACRLGYDYACMHQRIGSEKYSWSVIDEAFEISNLAFRDYEMMTPHKRYVMPPPQELIDY